jgi:hypothetical protein
MDNNNYDKKGLYVLVYPPKTMILTNHYENLIKVGRTGSSFKKRFQGYSGSDQVTDEVAVYLLPLEIPPGCKRNYGFSKEESWVKHKIKQGFMKTHSEFVKNKKDQSEHYFIHTGKDHIFLKTVLNLYKKIQDKNQLECECECEEEQEESVISSIWKYARSSFTTK